MARVNPHSNDFGVEIKQRAQAILEFALCLAMVATAIGSMAIYIRRSLQARYRAGVLYYAKEVGTEPQYEPYYTREAWTREDKKGEITEGRNTISLINMETNATGWRFTPLPGRMKISDGSTQPPETAPPETAPPETVPPEPVPPEPVPQWVLGRIAELEDEITALQKRLVDLHYLRTHVPYGCPGCAEEEGRLRGQINEKQREIDQLKADYF